MRTKTYVYVYFDFEKGKISIDEDFNNNGTPINEYHGRAMRHCIADPAEIVNSEEAETIIDSETRAEFARLCEEHYDTDYNGSNMVGVCEKPLRDFIETLCNELDEERSTLESNSRTFNGLGFTCPASEYLDREAIRAYGIDEETSDEEICRIAAEIDSEVLTEYQTSLEDTEDCLTWWRDRFREEHDEE
jgi:hypothetical protein